MFSDNFLNAKNKLKLAEKLSDLNSDEDDAEIVKKGEDFMQQKYFLQAVKRKLITLLQIKKLIIIQKYHKFRRILINHVACCKINKTVHQNKKMKRNMHDLNKIIIFLQIFIKQ